MSAIHITRAGPICTLQDEGRLGMLRHGISASGPMDRTAYARCGDWLGTPSRTAVEFTAPFAFVAEAAPLAVACDGGDFALSVNGVARPFPARLMLAAGDVVELLPGRWGNYGYLRFDREIDVPELLGSRATNLVAGLGGLEGRALRAGDRLAFGAPLPRSISAHPRATPEPEATAIRFVWGLHADLFLAAVRTAFVTGAFAISGAIDRMGGRLVDAGGVFGPPRLTLVSDPVVPGDIQILGDGTPIVLLRDHQPTGGYPRIGTIVTADLDLFVQLRPGSDVRFSPVTVATAQALLRQVR